MKEARIEVYGRVQGVGFRNTIKKFANNLNLRGTVLNLSHGGILIVAQGKERKINEFIFNIEKNPGFSRVDNVEVIWSDVVKRYEDFKIIRSGNLILDQLKSGINLLKSLLILDKKIENVPKHIILIPDGNRRWARFRGLEPHFGHYKAGSYANIESIFKEAKKIGIKCMSIWGFSTENWKRNKNEKKAIFELLLGGVERFKKDADKNRIRFRHIGRKDRLPKKLITSLNKLESITKSYDDFTIQLCLDYGGRDEILRAVNKLLKSGKKNINEEEFQKYLDTYEIPDPDLIIRTSGEKRLSGIMPFQSTYAELYFSKKYFPEFGARDLRQAINEYSKRIRRYGGDKVK